MEYKRGVKARIAPVKLFFADELQRVSRAVCDKKRRGDETEKPRIRRKPRTVRDIRQRRGRDDKRRERARREQRIFETLCISAPAAKPPEHAPKRRFGSVCALQTALKRAFGKRKAHEPGAYPHGKSVRQKISGGGAKDVQRAAADRRDERRRKEHKRLFKKYIAGALFCRADFGIRLCVFVVIRTDIRYSSPVLLLTGFFFSTRSARKNSEINSAHSLSSTPGHTSTL